MDRWRVAVTCRFGLTSKPEPDYTCSSIFCWFLLRLVFITLICTLFPLICNNPDLGARVHFGCWQYGAASEWTKSGRSRHGSGRSCVRPKGPYIFAKRARSVLIIDAMDHHDSAHPKTYHAMGALLRSGVVRVLRHPLAVA